MDLRNLRTFRVAAETLGLYREAGVRGTIFPEEALTTEENRGRLLTQIIHERPDDL